MSVNLISEFKEYKLSLNLMEKTTNEYVDSIVKFQEWYKDTFNKQRLGIATYKNLDRKITQDYIFYLRETLSVNSCKKHVAGMIQFMRYINREHGSNNDCFRGLEIPKDLIKEEKTYMALEEGELMFDKAHSLRDRLMVGLMLHEGLRIEEVVNLEIANIDTDKWTMKFLRKNKKYHTLPIVSALKASLENWIAECKSNGHTFLFQSPRVIKPLTTRATRNVFNDLRDELKLNSGYVPHMLRKCFAVNMYYNKGLALHKVSKLLNHESLKTTEIYLAGVREEQVYEEFAGL